MDAYKEYLNEIFTKTYDEILPLINKINEISLCPNCGGIYVDCVCYFCKNKNNDLEQLKNRIVDILFRLQETLHNLPITKIEYNKLFTLFFKIKNMQISVVDELINNYHYEDVLDEIYKKVLEKHSYNLDFDDIDIDVCEAIIYQNIDSKKRNRERINDLTAIFFRRTISNSLNDKKRKLISYESFSLLIKEFVEEQIKTLYKNGTCKIIVDEPANENDKYFATALYNSIEIYDYHIKSMYYEGNDSLINTIYHELCHVNQYRVIFSKKLVSEFELLEIKDRILSTYLNGYYNENYFNLSFELEAFYCGLKNSLIILDNLGFTYDPLNKLQLSEYKSKFLNKKRTFKGRTINIDDEVEKVLKDRSFLLDKYPCLKFYYKILNGVVVRKSDEELQNDYENLIDDSSLDKTKKDKYQIMFNLSKKESLVQKVV